MFELPDELWILLKDFLIEYKKHHKLKLKLVHNQFYKEYKISEIYTRWTYPPPIWKNTNEIIRDEYTLSNYRWAHEPDLKLTSITFNPNNNNNKGWWCGYGWKIKKLNKISNHN